MTAHQLLLGGTLVGTYVDIQNISWWAVGEPGDNLGATAGILYRPDGTVYIYEDIGLGDSYTFHHNWLVFGAAGDYQMRVNSVNAFFTTNQASGQYISMSNSILVTKAAARTADLYASGHWIVRKASDSSTVAWAVGSLRATGFN